MSIEAFEELEERIRLKAKLEAADVLRLAGVPTVSLEEARRRIDELYKKW